MITYHNTGTAGREYGKMMVSQTSDVPNGLEFQIRNREGTIIDLILNPEQANHLANAIQKHYKSTPKSVKMRPIIEGTL